MYQCNTKGSLYQILLYFHITLFNQSDIANNVERMSINGIFISIENNHVCIIKMSREYRN
jgi:hypothetical protein